MTTFKAGHDLKFTLQLGALVLGCVITLGAFFFYDNMIALMLALPLLLTAFVSVAQLHHTSYTLEDKLLEAKSGFTKVLVDYSSILQISDSKELPADGYVPLALSADRLYVYYTEDGKCYRLELSPLDKAGFMEALGDRCNGS